MKVRFNITYSNFNKNRFVPLAITRGHQSTTQSAIIFESWLHLSYDLKAQTEMMHLIE